VTDCRFCGTPLSHVFADLGMAPLANSILDETQLLRGEAFYPLRVFVCANCLLVQLPEFASPDVLFSDYAYFSSYSTTWLDHASRFAAYASERFRLDADSFVVEVASNDGYLLRKFQELGIPVLGVEPAANVAEVAIAEGVPTAVRFFGREVATDLASERQADLLVANNVLAHVPELNDFVAGIAALLAPQGVASIEFPHLSHLIEEGQFDTIYHEHFSYFSLITAERIFQHHGLKVVDVHELPTHGGSLRVFVARDGIPTDAVRVVRERERASGLTDVQTYATFSEETRGAKRRILSFFIDAKNAGQSIVGYGAPAKGNTLLNYCGIGTDFIDFTVDLNPHKQGRYLPGTHIPIRKPDDVRSRRPDLLFILPWNLQTEIIEQMSFIREWGGRFVVTSPDVRVIP
jgi:SAM-dependent methyltransferase